MSWAVHNIAGSVAGTQQAARATKRDVDRKEPAKARRARDEFDQSADASEAEHAEAVRSLKDNTQEEAHEDRQQHGEQSSLPSEQHDTAMVYHPGVPTPRIPSREGTRVDIEG